MAKVYLLTGSNLGNRKEILKDTCVEIETHAGKILEKSSLYQTKAWGNTQQPDFYNQALGIETEFPPEKLLEALLSIELKKGRAREKKWEARILDIDILFYENHIINKSNLIIPHPMLHRRRFTLLPLLEICPLLVHPVLKKSISELIMECADKLDVIKINEDDLAQKG